MAQTVVLKSFPLSCLHCPLLPLLSAVTLLLGGERESSCEDPFPVLISCFRSGNWVTKLSGAECKTESPRVSPVKKRLVYGSLGTNFGWLDPFLFLFFFPDFQVD